MGEPAPPDGLTAAQMSARCYQEGRDLLAAGHKQLADQLMAAGGYWWAVAKKGRAACWAALAKDAPARRPVGLRLLDAPGQAWAAGLVTEAEAAANTSPPAARP